MGIVDVIKMDMQLTLKKNKNINGLFFIMCILIGGELEEGAQCTVHTHHARSSNFISYFFF